MPHPRLTRCTLSCSCGGRRPGQSSCQGARRSLVKTIRRKPDRRALTSPPSVRQLTSSLGLTAHSGCQLTVAQPLPGTWNCSVVPPTASVICVCQRIAPFCGNAYRPRIDELGDVPEDVVGRGDDQRARVRRGGATWRPQRSSFAEFRSSRTSRTSSPCNDGLLSLWRPRLAVAHLRLAHASRFEARANECQTPNLCSQDPKPRSKPSQPTGRDVLPAVSP